MEKGWNITEDFSDATAKQKHALYRWGIPKTIVCLMTKNQAHEMLQLLAEIVSIAADADDARADDAFIRMARKHGHQTE